jgi:uncharacterized protein YjeT (DUF2065 family)
LAALLGAILIVAGLFLVVAPSDQRHHTKVRLEGAGLQLRTHNSGLAVIGLGIVLELGALIAARHGPRT